MINWLIIIFAEWLMLIYYFHSFPRSNKSKNTYNENFSSPKFLTIGPRQSYNLKISVRELLYSEIFCACPVELPYRFPKQYYTSQSEVVLSLVYKVQGRLGLPAEFVLNYFAK